MSFRFYSKKLLSYKLGLRKMFNHYFSEEEIAVFDDLKLKIQQTICCIYNKYHFISSICYHQKKQLQSRLHQFYLN